MANQHGQGTPSRRREAGCMPERSDHTREIAERNDIIMLRASNKQRTSIRRAAGLTLSLLVLGGIGIAGPRSGSAQVYSWGSNSNGQLGNGSSVNSSSSVVQVSNLTDVIAIAGGAHECAALKSNGTVWAWGQNNFGQLGDNSTTDRNSPVQVTNLTTATAIAGQGYHNLALLPGGFVWAWGSNSSGQLGTNTLIDSHIPVQVSNLSGVTAIAAGEFHSLALKSDGTVWAWGENSDGQLGNNSTIDSSVPVQVSSLTGVTAIAGEGSSSLALRSDGTVWAWGNNPRGELGIGNQTDSSVPVQVVNITGVSVIAANWRNGMALKSDGTVWMWGYNLNGTLGNGTTDDYLGPVQVSGLTGVTAIAGGWQQSMALKSDGTVWDWGYNLAGELGDGTTTTRTTPVQVAGLSGVVAITGGMQTGHALASVPPAPTGLTATPSGTQVSLSWTAPLWATSYHVKRSTVSGSGYATIASPTATSYVNTGLANGTTYYYVVSAVDIFGEGANSNQAIATLIPAAPTGLAATPSGTQVALSWAASSGATSYNVKRSTVSGSGYATVNNSASASYTNTGLSSGATYYYVVSAVNAAGESANSSQAATTLIPSSPAGLAATPSGSQVALSWTASSGATSYNVKRSTVSGSGYATVNSPSGASYTNTGLISGATYYYVVSALNGGGESANSSQATATLIPAAPTGLTPTPSGTQVALSWTSSSGATSYNVKRSTVSGSGYASVITGVTAASYTNTGLSSGATYYYVVSAVNAAGESANSGQASTTLIPAVPTGLTPALSGTQVALAWTASSGATSYNVKRSTVSGSGYVTINGPTGASYTDTGLANGSTYYYVVTAVNAGGESASSSQSTATLAPVAPTGLTATLGDMQITLTWTASAGATSYNIKRSTIDGSGYVTVGASTSAGYTNTGLTNGTAYYYVVSAVNGGGESAGSGQASATPQPAVLSVPTVTPINLTTLGTTDWVHWGLAGAAGVDRKSAGGSKIGNWTKIGAIAPQSYPDCVIGYTWSDGAPTAIAMSSTTGVYVTGQNNGFSFTAPADTTLRTLTVYLGGYKATGTLTAVLSDNSTSFTPVSATSAASIFNQTIAIRYKAASPGQTLTVTWKMTADAGGGNITLNAATLVIGPPAPDFNVTANSATIGVSSGASNTTTVRVTPYNSFPGKATLGVSGLPAGATAAFSPAATNGTSILTLSAASSVPQASYPITITGTSGSLSHSCSMTMTVTAPPVVTTIKLSPAVAQVSVLKTRAFTAVVYDQNGAPLATQPTITWTASGGGVFAPTGIFTAGAAAGGPHTITARVGTVSATASVVVTGLLDYNADGKSDLVLQNSASGTVTQWYLNGANVTGQANVNAGLLAGQSVATEGDFNGDGKPDIALVNSTSGQVSLWYMNGASVISTANLSTTVPAGWKVVCSGDFNTDGRRDLVLQNTATSQVSFWYLMGTLVTPSAPMAGSVAGWNVVGSGDFNNDGMPDLAVQNATTGQVGVWYLNGATYAGPAIVATTPSAGWKVVACADFNGDGLPDLALHNGANTPATFWYLNGVSVSSTGASSIAIPSGWSVAGPR
jgi:alpha-tubulin suppressor-like RCC1 family protein/fibronectin type 3 domain-containing protein